MQGAAARLFPCETNWLEEGAFKESGTMVRTVMVVIEKGANV